MYSRTLQQTTVYPVPVEGVAVMAFRLTYFLYALEMYSEDPSAVFLMLHSTE